VVHLEEADSIVVLGDVGRVAHQGSFAEVKKGAYLQNLLVEN
jgi:hypothetical protein